MLLVAGAADCISRFPMILVATGARAGTLLQERRQAGRRGADVSRKATAQTLDVKDSQITGPWWERGREGSRWQIFRCR